MNNFHITNQTFYYLKNRICLSLILFCSFSAYSHSPTASKLPVESLAEHSVWELHTPDGIGTGFFIGKNYLVTNLYIVSDTIEKNAIKNISLSQKGNSYTLKIKKILALSALHNLALLETEESVSNHLSLRDHPLNSSEYFFAPVYAGTLKTIQIMGKVLYENSYFYTFHINSLDLQGAGGSPVLDEQGQIVGVIFAGNHNILHAIKRNHLEEFLTGKTGSKCSDFVNAKSCIIKETEYLKKLAERGHSPARYKLAEMYYNGIGVEQNPELAFYWFEKAAEQGFAPAQTNLAVLYDMGKGIEQDSEKAIFWYEKAAKKGDMQARYNLAMIHKKAKGAEQNFRLAFEGFRFSALWGLIPAQFQLAMMYYHGRGTEQNLEWAFQWCKKAAEQGHPEAQFQLGAMLEEGIGTEQNSEQALQWYEKAIKQGHPEAQFHMGIMFETGIGREKDLKQAVFWYEKAAEQGLPEAQFHLGMMYKEGTGTKKNLRKALKLITAAAEQGYHPTIQNNSSKSSPFPCKDQFTKR